MGPGADAASTEESHWKLSPLSLQYDAADVTDHDNFGAALEANRQVLLVRMDHTPETYDVCGVHRGKRQGGMDYVTLANHWQIPLHKARNMVKQMMQRGMHTVLHPTLLRHFRTNNWMLCYWRMPRNIFSDKMFCPKVPSARGYTNCADLCNRLWMEPQLPPCHARAKPLRPLVSFLHGKVSLPR